jgi:hypothetical protein
MSMAIRSLEERAMIRAQAPPRKQHSLIDGDFCDGVHRAGILTSYAEPASGRWKRAVWRHARITLEFIRLRIYNVYT